MVVFYGYEMGVGPEQTKHAEVEKEYKAVQENNNTPEWERLYWENEKEYYEEKYSRGTETDEYKVVLKELANLDR